SALYWLAIAISLKRREEPEDYLAAACGKRASLPPVHSMRWKTTASG
ncbi:MAG TPA: hypothetical protein DCF63_07505, partial [Planctomycetaceae bacterium]|nr:hypothetical protein [Planctomycetaceae bacterium]